jgi:hypothetical protein
MNATTGMAKRFIPKTEAPMFPPNHHPEQIVSERGKVGKRMSARFVARAGIAHMEP